MNHTDTLSTESTRFTNARSRSVYQRGWFRGIIHYHLYKYKKKGFSLLLNLHEGHNHGKSQSSSSNNSLGSTVGLLGNVGLGLLKRGPSRGYSAVVVGLGVLDRLGAGLGTITLRRSGLDSGGLGLSGLGALGADGRSDSGLDVGGDGGSSCVGAGDRAVGHVNSDIVVIGVSAVDSDTSNGGRVCESAIGNRKSCGGDGGNSGDSGNGELHDDTG